MFTMSEMERTTTRTTKSYKRSVLLTSLMRDEDSDTPIGRTSDDTESGAGAAVVPSLPATTAGATTGSPSDSRMTKAVTTTATTKQRTTTSTGSRKERTTASALLLHSPVIPFPRTYCSILSIPFLGRAPLKTVPVPKALVEMDPPTVRTAKTVLCSYKVRKKNLSFFFCRLSTFGTRSACLFCETLVYPRRTRLPKKMLANSFRLSETSEWGSECRVAAFTLFYSSLMFEF